VRGIAGRLGLRTAAKPESYDVCFIPDGDTQGWLERRLGSRPGELVDATGRVLGRHRGAYRFTVGQRRGLGIAAPTPRYVLRVEPAAGRVVVGERAELATRTVELERASATDGRGLRAGRAQVRLRAHGAETGCLVVPLGGDRVRLELDAPVDAVAPGQAGVLYRGDLVLGGGTVAGEAAGADAGVAAGADTGDGAGAAGAAGSAGSAGGPG
jgi:tRNA-specific 2-thiouridylase